MTTRPTPRRTLVVGLSGGVAFLVGTFLTFALLGGSRKGAWAFWAVPALAEGFAIAAIAERPSHTAAPTPTTPEPRPAGTGGT